MGYRSSLKSSQSISDLSSHIPSEKHHRQGRISTGNRIGQTIQSARLTNTNKPPPNPKPKFNPNQLSANKAPLSGNAYSKFETPRENILPKSQTTACISEKIKPKSNPKRPITLSLKKTEKYKLSLNKANQSLPESPVCEELKILKEKCRKNGNRFARFAAKRKSCSYFIGLNDNETELENITKSFESLPAMNELIEHKSVDASGNDDDGNGSFSDDSLEGDYKNPPRRCVSDYLIFNYPELSENQNYPNYQNLRRRIMTQSQESILSDVSVESFSKGSAEILDYNFEHERHSSASFFLSRRKMQACRSQESILTDESDYQMFPLRETADHRSTESVLTDDSDSLVKSAPLEMLFDSHYKRKRQNSETYGGNSNNPMENKAKINSHKASDDPSQLRAVSRSKSLQDTRLNAVKTLNYHHTETGQPVTSVYYDFNLGDHNEKSNNPEETCGIDSKAKGNCSKASGEPKSMFIPVDFVAHKPPKPKRNSARTQSMRNRARPAWNKYNLDASQSQYSECLTNYHCTDRSQNPEVSSTSEHSAAQEMPDSSQKSDESVDTDRRKNRSEDNLKKFEKFVQCSKYSSQTGDNQMEKSKYLSLPLKQAKQITYFEGHSDYESKSNVENENYQEAEITSHTNEDAAAQISGKENEQNKHFENEIPTKDTPERYDSLEPNLDLSHNFQASGVEASVSAVQIETKNIRMQDKNVDIRISRAIEGTVKLLSKEFENLVRRETYFAQSKDLRQLRGQDASENFAKLEAERDTKGWMLRREARGLSGEDSDCADISAMDRSIVESGSSTSASSCTNSPKRLWPPASHCQSHAKWTKKLPTINQAILPSKQHYAGTSEYGKSLETNRSTFMQGMNIISLYFRSVS